MTVKRRRYGATGHGYTIDGEKVPGVTTVLSMLPKDALKDWAARTSGEYAVDNWDTLAALKLSERLKLISNAHRTVRDAAARRGTEVHALGAALVEGREVSVPDELAGHVEAYRDWLDRVEPVAVQDATELVVASREHRYCGTSDLVADMPDLVADGALIPACRWLLELKTTSSGVWPESALQACAYSRAEVFGVLLPWCGECDDEQTRVRVGPRGGRSKCDACHPEQAGLEERPMEWLGIQRCGVVWIKSDACELRPLDTGDEVWEFFLHLRWLHEREEFMRGWIGSPASTVQVLAPA
jgi:hypothetical protein